MNYLSPLLLLVSFLWSALPAGAQPIAPEALLDQSIRYHDPAGQWGKTPLTLELKETRPSAPDRLTSITIDLSREYFRLEQQRDHDLILREVHRGECRHQLNGQADIPESDRERLRLDCERSQTMRDYYTYLWGLPMKLRDPGTILGQEVLEKEFQGETYYALRVTYNPEVGGDTWYFFFDRTTYALRAYQFFHEEASNDGEYILLEGESTVNGLRLPRVRRWYVNADAKYLGADILDQGE